MKLNDLKYRGMFQPDTIHHKGRIDFSEIMHKNQAAKKLINKRKKKSK